MKIKKLSSLTGNLEMSDLEDEKSKEFLGALLGKGKDIKKSTNKIMKEIDAGESL